VKNFSEQAENDTLSLAPIILTDKKLLTSRAMAISMRLSGDYSAAYDDRRKAVVTEM